MSGNRLVKASQGKQVKNQFDCFVGCLLLGRIAGCESIGYCL